ncbi:MAG TPA: glycosyltransferase 87 family protein [Acidobacteriaceae bacterium]|nr:glycosyltransferase 87 family protein [Acidobacteriaceae bacterium]
MELDSVTTPPGARSSTRWLRPLFVLFILAAPLWHLHVINREMPSNHSDLVDEWVGVRDAFQGKDPYSATGMRDTQIAYYGRPLTPADNVDPQGFPYPATFVVLFAPLALLSWHAARLIFLISTIPLLLIGAWLCIRSVNLPLAARRTTLIVFLYLCSWPVMWGLRLQQPTLIVAVLIFSASWLLSRERDVPAGIFMAVAAVKPQLVLPLLLWFLLWTLLRRRWGFSLAFLATTLIVLSVAERVMPGWFGHWLNELNGYRNFHGSLPLAFPFGHWIGMLATLALVGWSCTQLWRLRRCSPCSTQFSIAVALALSTSLCLTLTKLPTLYNQAVLLPGIVLLTFAKVPEYYPSLIRRLALFLCAWSFASLFLAVIGESLVSASDFWIGLSFQDILLPVLVTIALTAVLSSLRDLNSGEKALFGHLFTPGNSLTGNHIYDSSFYYYIRRGATRSAEVVVPLVTKFLPVSTVLDVGCGAGAWLAVYRALGISCTGIDGEYVEPSSLMIPVNEFKPHDITHPFDLKRRFSLVQCLEVAEHIEKATSRTLIANLVRHGDCILFSAAVPGQGGENHINEQPYSFWRELFAEHGYFPIDCLRPALQNDSRVEPWYRHNAFLYVSEDYRADLSPAIARYEIPANAPMADVSSFFYRVRKRILRLLPTSSLTRIAVLKHRAFILAREISGRSPLIGVPDETVLP